MYEGELLKSALTSGEELARRSRLSIMDSDGRPRSAESTTHVSHVNRARYNGDIL